MNLIDRLERAGHPVRERLGLPATPPSQAEAAPPPQEPESRITRLAREKKLPPKVAVPQ